LFVILPDYLARGLDAVFCGTAAGDKSAQRKHYFSDPTNRFWEVLATTGFTPEALSPDRDHEVLSHRLGLTDLVKFNHGIDAKLRSDMYDVAGFCEKIARFEPRYVAFTSKEAACRFYGHGKTKLVSYGLQSSAIGRTKLFVLPSTSGSARRHWDEIFWRELAQLIRAR
jgi:TDG/mug DNA glycosylase family protein